MVYWQERRAYVAVVASDVRLRARVKAMLETQGVEVSTFPDDRALLPELDRLRCAERASFSRYHKVLVVQGNLNGSDHGMTTARWARPYFDRVFVMGDRRRHWVDAVGACRADAFLDASKLTSLATGVVTMLATA